MKIKSCKFLMLSCIFFLSSCGQEVFSKSNKCVILIENNPNIKIDSFTKKVTKGEDLCFDFYIPLKSEIKHINYDDYKLTSITSDIEDKNKYSLTLNNVQYSAMIKIQLQYYNYQITYHANGGNFINSNLTEMKINTTEVHLRSNTSIGTDILKREGHILKGWNTSFDCRNHHIGLGSRITRKENLILYASWEKYSSASLFEYHLVDGKATITNYLGQEKKIVIPEFINDTPVLTIDSNCFSNLYIDELILPKSILRISADAFKNCYIEKLYMYDNILYVSNNSFNQSSIKHLYINAAMNPTYSGTYFDSFQDKYDRLLLLNDKKKLVLAGGSAWRFGVDSKRLDDAFEDYNIFNMGVFAYTNMLPQYELMLQNMNEGDILLVSPEFDTIEEQFCVRNNVDYATYAMMESSYDTFSTLNIQDYTDIFWGIERYNSRRVTAQKGHYDISVSDYDEDRNFSSTKTYNEYGDYIHPRPNNEKLELFGVRRASYNKEDFPLEYISRLNNVYQKFINKGIHVYFTYSPRSNKSVTENTTEQSIIELDSYLKEHLNVPIISSIHDSLMSPYYFNGTDNHLSDDGVQIRTTKLIDDLSLYIKNEANN